MIFTHCAGSPSPGKSGAILRGLQRAEARGREIARDAEDAEVQSGRFGVRLISMTGSSRPA
jgi:hypothetical protein